MYQSDKITVFVCPNFFNYKEVIEAGLIKKTPNIITFSDRPQSSSFSKAIIKFNVLGLRQYFSRQYSQSLFDKLKPVSHNISTLFIVKGTCIDAKLIHDLKRINSDIKVIIYNWDSVSNAQYFLNLSKVADRVISFDMNDCLNYSFKYVPLFCQHGITKNTPVKQKSKKYHFYFIGSYHSDRINVLKRLSEINGSESFVRIFFQSKLQYAFYWMLDAHLRKAPKYWITFTALSHQLIDDIAIQSNYAVDIHHDAQYGITMRSWEVIGSKNLLITTNPNILFHVNDETVVVIDRETGREWIESERRAFIDNNLSTLALINDYKCVNTIDIWLEKILLTE